MHQDDSCWPPQVPNVQLSGQDRSKEMGENVNKGPEEEEKRKKRN
jgi:hypothetical protein